MFTTTKKKVEKVEKYDIPVLTMYPVKDVKGSAYQFALNKAAMEAFKFTMNTPNVNRISNGYDDNNTLLLAAFDTKDVYTSNITAKNTFSSKKLHERLCEAFLPYTTGKEEVDFMLIIEEEDGILMGLPGIITDDTIDEAYEEARGEAATMEEVVEQAAPLLEVGDGQSEASEPVIPDSSDDKEIAITKENVTPVPPVVNNHVIVSDEGW